jgi:phage terminase large subunit-like protein
MARRKPSSDPLDVVSEFTTRLERQKYKPNINRYTPMPQQAAFHASQTKNRIASGGNRGGKTYSGIADDVLILTRKHPHRAHLYPPLGQQVRMRFIGVDFDRGIDQTALPLFSQFIPPSFLKNGSWEDSYRAASHMLTLDDGADSTVSFMSYEQDSDKFQSVTLHHIHFDEEPPQAIWNESMLRLLDTNGTWTLSETPVQQMEWIEDELIEPALSGARPDISVFYFDTRENIHLSPDALEEITRGLSAEEKIIRLAGQYTNGSLVFPEFKRTYPNVIPQDAFWLTDDWRVYESMDHGYVNPTAWLWTAVHADGSIVTFDSLYSKNIVVEEWAKLVHQKRAEIRERFGIDEETWHGMYGGAVGDPSIGDRGNATAQTGITIQQAYGLAGIHISTAGIRQARAENQNIGLDKIHTYLRSRPDAHPTRPGMPWWQITDNNTFGIDELKRARKPKQSAANKEVKSGSEGIRDKDNHWIDAAKYLFIVTHDLRPERYRVQDDAGLQEQISQYLAPVPTQYGTHDDIFRAANVSGWSTSSLDYYPSVED